MGHYAIYVRCLLGWRYISLLHCADESQRGRDSCPLLRSCFIGSCHVWCFKTSFTWYQPCSLLSSLLFWPIRPLVDPMLVAFIVCGPLQFLATYCSELGLLKNLRQLLCVFEVSLKRTLIDRPVPCEQRSLRSS